MPSYCARCNTGFETPDLWTCPLCQRRMRPRASSMKNGPRRRYKLKKRDGAYCRHCGTNRNLTIDHIVPRSKGGSNRMENLQLLCWACNQKKADSVLLDEIWGALDTLQESTKGEKR